MRLVTRLAPAVLLLLVGTGFGQPPIGNLSLERMKKDIHFLAGPACEGRGIETEGLNKAADHIAATFKEAGLKPAGKDGTFFQPFPINGYPEITGPSTLAFAGPGGKDQTPQSGGDFRPSGFATGGKTTGGLVFVGHGVKSPARKYDDYAGLDVTGKFVIVIRSTPRPGVEGNDRFDATTPAGFDTPYAKLAHKLDNAAAHKVAGIIFVNDPKTADEADQLFAFEEHKYRDPPARMPVLHLKRAAASKLLKEALGKSLEDLEAANDKELKPQSAELTGWTATADLGVTRKEYTVKNVVGVLEGSGPLADETVVVGAHYDHLGYGDTDASAAFPAGKGKVHYGADDNASGTTGLLELARRFGAMKERRGRRLVFVAFSGEERGLIGSKFYCDHPSFPLESTAAMANLDMIGRMRPGPGDWLGITTKDRVTVYGTGTAATFDALTDAAESRSGLKFIKIPGGNGRSDHEMFFARKIPVLFFFTGFHDDYHKPSDTPDKIDLPRMLRVVDVTEDLVLDLSTTLARPRFTKPPVSDDPHAGVGPVKQGVLLGVRPDYAYMGGDGMRIEGVSPGRAAEKAGLKDGDVIVDIAGVPVRSVQGYMASLGDKRPGQSIEVTILRGGKKMVLTVKP